MAFHYSGHFGLRERELFGDLFKPQFRVHLDVLNEHAVATCDHNVKHLVKLNAGDDVLCFFLCDHFSFSFWSHQHWHYQWTPGYGVSTFFNVSAHQRRRLSRHSVRRFCIHPRSWRKSSQISGEKPLSSSTGSGV